MLFLSQLRVNNIKNSSLRDDAPKFPNICENIKRLTTISVVKYSVLVLA